MKLRNVLIIIGFIILIIVIGYLYNRNIKSNNLLKTPLEVTQEYCKNKEYNNYCDVCAFKELKDTGKYSPKNLTEFREKGFNCKISEDIIIYEVEACSNCADIGCTPENTPDYYFVNNRNKKIEAVFNFNNYFTPPEITNKCFLNFF